MPTIVLRPLAIRSSVVCYPVQNHLEALLMRFLKEMLEVFSGTKLRIDRAVVDNRVVTA